MKYHLCTSRFHCQKSIKVSYLSEFAILKFLRLYSLLQYFLHQLYLRFKPNGRATSLKAEFKFNFKVKSQLRKSTPDFVVALVVLLN